MWKLLQKGSKIKKNSKNMGKRLQIQWICTKLRKVFETTCSQSIFHNTQSHFVLFYFIILYFFHNLTLKQPERLNQYLSKRISAAGSTLQVHKHQASRREERYWVDQIALAQAGCQTRGKGWVVASLHC